MQFRLQFPTPAMEVNKDIDVPPLSLSVPSKELTLSRTLNQLPSKERDEVLHEIHGVSEVLDEDPGFVSQNLDLLELELQQIPKKIEYEMALSLSLEYVTNRNFRLKFLRADNYDSKKAAARMVKFFEWKLDLFGEDKLVQEIVLSDFEPREVEAMKSGYIQLLPQRDRAGRSILFTIRSLLPDISLESRLRLFWYYAMTALEDEQTQLRGTVFVYYALGPQRRVYRYSDASKLPRLVKVVPLRFVAVHGCYSDPKLRPYLDFAAVVMENALRVRLRFHTGTHLESQYALMTFGIPKVVIPIDADGIVSTQNNKDWLAMRVKQEETEEVAFKRIIVPGHFDVLMGRGKKIEENPGNLRLRHLIEVNGPRYDEASKFEKTVVAEAIMAMIRDIGGRFLKQGEAGWMEVADDTARDKISHSFRNQRSRETSRLRRQCKHMPNSAPFPIASGQLKRLRR